MWTSSTIEDLQLLDLDYGTSIAREKEAADLSYNRVRRSLKIFLFGKGRPQPT